MRTHAAHMLMLDPSYLQCIIASTNHTHHTAACLAGHRSSCHATHDCTSAAAAAAMAAAGGLVSSKLLRLQGAGVGALAGFFSAAAVASASASGGGDGSNACPAYPWPPQDG